MSDFISHAVSLLWVKLSYGILLRLCMESSASELFIRRCIWLKFIGKGCSIFFPVLMLRYLVLQDIKYCMVPTLAAQQQNFRYVLMLVCFSA